MSDLPLDFPDADLAARLASALDVEGKLPRALDALASMAGCDVVLLDAGTGLRARQLVALGARVTAVERDAAFDRLDGSVADGVPGIVLARGEPDATGLPPASADVLVACWSALRGPDPAELAEAERVLRPGGRILAVHDYGRDDVSRLLAPDRPEYGSWSRRGGPFLGGGFKVRVIHCWWTFPSVEDASAFLRDGFGPAAEAVVASLSRPRLSYNVAIYHRTVGEPRTDARVDGAATAAEIASA